MANNNFKIKKGVNLDPQSGSTVTAEGDVAYRDDTKKLEIHDGTSADNVVQEAKAATLTNKTLTAPVISTISNTGTLTLPTSTDTLVGRATTDTLTNKTISGASNTITNVSLTTGVTGVLPIANGGTHTGSTPTNGQLLIGNGTDYTLAAISAGANITVTNGAGSITIASTASGGGGTPATLTIPNMTDWVSYSPTITASGSNPTKGTVVQEQAMWRRVGDSMEIHYNFEQSSTGSAGGGAYQWSLPAGYTIDTTKATAFANAASYLHGLYLQGSVTAFGSAAGSQLNHGYVIAIDSTHLSLIVSNDVNAPTLIGNTFLSFGSNSTERISFHAFVPIVGWSANATQTITAGGAAGPGFQGYIDTATNVLAATTTTGTPATGFFYSSIINRASITDIVQDLKPRIGVERISLQNLYQIQKEFVTGGGQVFGVINDKFDLVRLVGAWYNGDTLTHGQYIAASVTGNDIIEITFYGTGLNVLHGTGGGRDIRYRVDGGSESSNIVVADSGIIDSRNYAANVVLQITKGLTLGVHTVTIRSASTSNGMILQGFEVLNESSSVTVNKGVSYINGSSLTNTAQATFSYSAPVTGTKGGRVLVYQKTDGTIDKAFQAVDASSQVLTSTDHTNEEVARVYYPREFGMNRSDDFSTLSGGGVHRSFTLEDGVTSLVLQKGRILAPGTTGTIYRGEVLGIANGGTTGDYLVFTFVGCGLDILHVEGGTQSSPDSFTYSIDGGSAATLLTTGLTTPTTQKIASGLKYGTHTVKIIRSNATATNWDYGIIKLIVYQPKKPTLPAGAVELADYNVLANYAGVATVVPYQPGDGVLVKSLFRELAYVQGTGGSSDWTYNNGGNNAFDYRYFFQTDRQNAYISYTFFGTGFEINWTGHTNRQQAANISLNGTAFTTANFGTPATNAVAVGTGTSWNATTGVLNMATTTDDVQGVHFYASGLTLGVYTIKILSGNASQFLTVNSINIVTPIHSFKSDQADMQNSLPVGSNSISDNRQITPVKDLISSKKGWAMSLGSTSSPTTSSTTAVPIPEMSCMINTVGGPIEVNFQSRIDGAPGNVQIYVDGIKVGNDGAQNAGGSVVSDTVICPVSPGAHKVDVYWFSASASTLTAVGTHRVITVKEL